MQRVFDRQINIGETMPHVLSATRRKKKIVKRICICMGIVNVIAIFGSQETYATRQIV
jgi:hypothetical protein